MRGLLALTLLAAPLPRAGADVKLPAIFSEHMVLQSDTAVQVWGWAEPGEEVAVSIGGRAATAKTAADGKWRVNLGGLKPGGPHTLTVQGKNTVTVGDVLIGEVWLGSGQSNMALSVRHAKDAAQEQASAKLPQIRLFTVESAAAETAQEDCRAKWQVCSPGSVGGFSATLFYFGREIHQALGVPVGLMDSSVGGTPIESWISAEAQQSAPELKAFFEKQKEVFDPRPPKDPTAAREKKSDVGGLFNGKIAPLIPYAIRGAVWYQGESNTDPWKAPFYRHQLPLLVKDWRARWGEDFPFAWVQLPNYGRHGPHRNWPLIREAMLQALREPKTGMAITIDIGEAKAIHPKNKQEVGRRLALWALGTVYGRKNAVSGPLLAGQERRGSEMVLSFRHTDGGLVARGGELRGFTIAGAGGQWIPAVARIEGERVVVSAPGVAEPVAVRYAWENNPDVNLFNAAGLPASPFRTDSEPSP